MNNKVIKSNAGRRRVSLFMVITFILLIPSGIMMHLNDGTVLNSSKHLAMMIHNLCAVIFVITGMFHIKYNFILIKKYITEIFN